MKRFLSYHIKDQKYLQGSLIAANVCSLQSVCRETFHDDFVKDIVWGNHLLSDTLYTSNQTMPEL